MAICKPLENNPTYYYKTQREAARAARAQLQGTLFAETFKLYTTRGGWTVQLHIAGPYLGSKLHPKLHSCADCPT